MKKVLFFVCIFLSSKIFAQLKLADLFCNHAILQRNKNIPIWGWASPGEKVTVLFAKQKWHTKADAFGKWKISCNPMPAGGPYTLQVSNQKSNIEVTDILIGEVWLCSGQSNMEWPVKQSNHFLQEKQVANYPSIRHFFVAHTSSFIQEEHISNTPEWIMCTPQTVGDFTAVGYFFAKEMFQKLNIPIGLVHASWGGSQIESWISKDAFLQSNEFATLAKSFPTNWQEADEQLEASIQKKIFGAAPMIITKDSEAAYLLPNYNFDKWHDCNNALQQWDWLGIWAWRGNGFMAKKINIPTNMVATNTTLGLANCYANIEVYINGRKVYTGLQKGPRTIQIPANTWIDGDNKLLIKMDKMIDPAWYGVGFMGNPSDFFVSNENDKLPIETTQWKIMPAFAQEHSFAHSSNNAATIIYNSMIAPLVPFAIKGCLWYQGESNAGRSYQYRTAFPLMINNWRNKWKDTFDFYFVQLANYGANQNSNIGSGWAELREAQTMALAVPKTGMAVTIDIGNAKDIHPTNKQDVGKRLAAAAFATSYGLPIVYSGPTYSKVIFDGNKAIVSFNNMGSGLVTNDKYGYIKGFEIAGTDSIFHYATANIINNKVVVYHAMVNQPIAVRYAWADAPNDANLFNKEGLPTCPFRTDNWKGVTENEKFK